MQDQESLECGDLTAKFSKGFREGESRMPNASKCSNKPRTERKSPVALQYKRKRTWPFAGSLEDSDGPSFITPLYAKCQEVQRW